MNKPLACGAIALALALGLSSAQAPIRVGIAFDAGGKNDRSFNQSAFEGATRAAKDLKVQVSDFEPSDPSQVGTGLRAFAQNDFDLIIGVGFANEPSITALAKEFKDLNFAVVDSVSSEPNVAGLTFKEQEGSYLVGYIAGKSTSTGVVGFVGGMDIPLIHKFEAGYRAGVMAACSTCRVIATYVGTTPAAWNDPTKAKEIAANHKAQGADIIYAAAGASGGGVIEYVKSTQCIKASELRGMRFRTTNIAARIPRSREYSARCTVNDRPMFFIGVDANQNYLGDKDNDPNTLNHALTSMVKRVDVAVYSVISDVARNRFKGGPREFGLANDGVGYAIDNYNRALIPASLVTELERIKRDIISGKIKVPDKR